MHAKRNLAMVLLAALALTSVGANMLGGVVPRDQWKCPTSHDASVSLIPHESDCSKFYFCFHENKILAECGLRDAEGNRLHFDVVIQGCVWPKDTECASVSMEAIESEETTVSDVDDSTSSTTENPVNITTDCPAANDGDAIHFAHESDCGLYYKCNHGERVLRRCPSGLAFNPIAQVCDWPELAGCTAYDSDDSGDSTVTEPSTGESTDSWTPESSSDGGIESSTENNLEILSSTTEVQVIIPTECPDTNEGNAVHIAHASDCGLYYQCNHGEKVLQRCPSGLAFNPIAQVCDWPEFAGCTTGNSDDSGDSTGTETPTEESSTYSSTPESSGDGEIESSTENDLEILSSTTESPVVIPTECPDTNEGNAVHIAHASDCGLYYQCNHGEKVLQRCPPGLAFNPIAQVCDWPEFAGCTTGISDDSGDSTGTETPTEESSTYSSTPESSGDGKIESSTENDLEILSSTTESPVVIPTECPDTNEGNAVHIAHASDCGLYYQCNHGEKVLQRCPPGLAFNPIAQVCDWPEFAGCTTGISDDSGDSTGTETPTEESSTYSSTPESSGDGEIESSTENDLEILSSTTEVQVIIPTECPDTNEGNAVYIAHASDCGLYYQCNHGEKVLQRCPPGLAFNPIAQVCDWPEFAGCTTGNSDDSGDSTETETPTEESSTYSSTPESSGDGEIESSTGNDLEILSSTTEVQVIIPTECPDTNEDNAVHIAHASDCGLYYQCNHGEKVLQRCPPGLAFNPIAQVCDWPEFAGCTTGNSDDSGDSTETETPTEESSTYSSTPESSGDGKIESSTENDLEILSSTTESPVVIPTECPDTNEGNAVHIAHEYDCGLFYVCNHGQKIQMQCPGGLKFNAVTQVCDWNVKAQCSVGAPHERMG